MRNRIHCALQWAALAWLLPARPGMAADVSLLGGSAGIPVLVAPFEGDAAGEDAIASIVRADLRRSGLFQFAAEASAPRGLAVGMAAGGAPFSNGAQPLVLVGRVSRGVRLAVDVELHDARRHVRLFGTRQVAAVRAARDIAHAIADAVYRSVTGVPGAFHTRLAYVQAPSGRTREWRLMLADADGARPRVLETSLNRLATPAWSPDATRIAYVEEQAGHPIVRLRELGRAKRLREVGAFPGSNLAPAFAPDGLHLAMTLTMRGNPDIYLVPLGSGAPAPRIVHPAIDTQAAWRGNTLCFTSLRSGEAQVYCEAGNAAAITYAGQGEASEEPSFDATGRVLAVTRHVGGRRRIAVLDSRMAQPLWRVVSAGLQDAHPSLAANGAFVAYTAQDGPQTYIEVASVNGRTHERLGLPAGARDAAFSPARRGD